MTKCLTLKVGRKFQTSGPLTQGKSAIAPLIYRPLQWMELTSPPRLSTKEARIIGLCAMTRAKTARATVCGSSVGSL
ncbi:hypothetical protein E2I00_016438 [Balaenoptera physalus]|nr:hypothetical protein E2I00_016438 [Balaenoptera physalus]